MRNEHGAGGLYVWESRAAAEAWFTEAKLQEYTTLFGARPTIALVRCPIAIESREDPHGDPPFGGQPCQRDDRRELGQSAGPEEGERQGDGDGCRCPDEVWFAPGA